uniref:Uncharacterized protein n=1 Tax=Haemonchus contortus TaxID=6289 RepID=A0A7I4XYY0_HAECO
MFDSWRSTLAVLRKGPQILMGDCGPGRLGGSFDRTGSSGQRRLPPCREDWSKNLPPIPSPTLGRIEEIPKQQSPMKAYTDSNANMLRRQTERTEVQTHASSLADIRIDGHRQTDKNRHGQIADRRIDRQK